MRDLVGPGQGDIYFGEGWTLGFQDRYRFGLTFDEILGWQTKTQEITTYDILDRTNQYIYTTRDIENIIDNLDGDIAGGSDVTSDNLTTAQQTWSDLLEKNIAYQWSEFYIDNADKLAELQAKVDAGEELSTLEAFQLDQLETAATHIANNGDGDVFEAFREAMELPEDSAETSADQEVETLIFSAGPAFEYSRTIAESHVTTYSREATAGTEGRIEFGAKAEIGTEVTFLGTKVSVGVEGESKGMFALTTSTNWSAYPPEIDQNNSYEKEYSVVIEVDEIEDAPQIFKTLTLTPRFADLQPPTTQITAPYDGQRISPAMFNDTDETFTIKVISTDSDIANIRIESRSKRQDSVWGEWSLLGGLTWTEGVDAAPTNLGGNPA
ncbi:hypothetical protein HYR99_02490 [Candidatus Poribacteria bacterium]|nr:hypothetical protein [Candidatus Poribacteria bacterium]